jgi:hypothetical protein
MNCTDNRQGFMPEGVTDKIWAAVLKRDDLILARRSFPDLSVSESLQAAGINLRYPDFEELPYQFDNLFYYALSAENEGNWFHAAQLYEKIADRHQNALWMKKLAAKAFYQAKDYNRAGKLCSQVNQHKPSVDTLLLEAKLRRRDKNYDSAIELLTTAKNTLQEY